MGVFTNKSMDVSDQMFLCPFVLAPQYPPGNVRVSSIDKFTVELNWDEAEGADYYRVCRLFLLLSLYINAFYEPFKPSSHKC